MTNINTANDIKIKGLLLQNRADKSFEMQILAEEEILIQFNLLKSALLEAQELNKVLVEALELVVKHGYGVNIEKNLKVRNTAFVAKEALAKFKQMRGEG